MYYDVIVIGGGPAGLAAAIAAEKKGCGKVLIIERDRYLGGILNQCIHNGFGLHYFKEELTGPEYAQRFIDMLQGGNIELSLDSMVLNIREDKTVEVLNASNGYRLLKAGAIVLATGCRERSRGGIFIPGTRPSGIFTAGAAQRYVNIEGYMVGKRVVILGSGDIGLIMARRMVLEGAEVLACVEIMPYSGGLNRNIVQCLDDYNIPLLLSHTVTDIKGDPRLEQLTVMKVDENRAPIPGSEIIFDCDTLLLSVGLIPENEISKLVGVSIDSRTGGPIVSESMQTSVNGIFAAGNSVHVHDLVDFVTQEAALAGASAADYVMGEEFIVKKSISVKTAERVTYTVPQNIQLSTDKKSYILSMRVNKIMPCATIEILDGDRLLVSYKREHLTPGEMQRITMPSVILDTVVGEYITVRIREGV